MPIAAQKSLSRYILYFYTGLRQLKPRFSTTSLSHFLNRTNQLSHFQTTGFQELAHLLIQTD